MPWHVAKRGSKFAVIKNDTGEVVPPMYKTRGQAMARVKALYANMPEGEKKS